MSPLPEPSLSAFPTSLLILLPWSLAFSGIHLGDTVSSLGAGLVLGASGGRYFTGILGWSQPDIVTLVCLLQERSPGEHRQADTEGPLMLTGC